MKDDRTSLLGCADEGQEQLSAGNDNAARPFAGMLLEGQLVRPDASRARELLEIAMAGGDAQAALDLARGLNAQWNARPAGLIYGLPIR